MILIFFFFFAFVKKWNFKAYATFYHEICKKVTYTEKCTFYLMTLMSNLRGNRFFTLFFLFSKVNLYNLINHLKS